MLTLFTRAIEKVGLGSAIGNYTLSGAFRKIPPFNDCGEKRVTTLSDENAPALENNYEGK